MSLPRERGGLAARIEAETREWVALAPLDPAVLATAERALERLRPTVPDRAAAIDLPDGQGGCRLWRCDYLRLLARSGLLPPDAGAAALEELAGRHAAIHDPAAAAPAAPLRRGRVLLVSAFGIRRFGGAEHFLMQMARLYAQLGHDPLVVGMRAEFAGESGRRDGVAFVNIAARPAALLRLAIEEGAVLAHVVSGLGPEVAAGLRFLDMRLVFGLHFWREMFFSRVPETGYYPDGPAGHAPRPSFPLLLADYDAVYANSEFTREVAEAQFGARLPVIPSLADDLPEAAPSPHGRDHVLLVNARADKGFELLLDLAALLPGLRFRAIASQSEAAAARAAVAARGLANVEILAPVEDMTALYRRARVVLVPSYRFVESFSRVVIEAHRHGVPVLGSDRGNVARLLRDSGQALPPEPVAWAEALRRLCHDPAHWQARAAAALENSRRHPFAAQLGRLDRLLRGLEAPLLVGAGSGAGNLIHVTPLLRNLARRLGHPVDVVVAGDWPGSLCLVADPEHVRHVFLLSDVPVRRRYDTVLLTHSFGPLVPAFRARRVLASRDWDLFHPGHRLHEVEFNLAAARALLGVPYDPEDARAASVAGIRYAIPAAGRRIGLHAGSKSGAWAQKRWPHFQALAERLTAEGFEVASFGTPDEYVPGTLDLTGGSLEEMTHRMLGCRAFVANDSGVMNIANALGIPLVALFGPTSARTRGPLGRNSVTLAVAKPCAPCELAGAGGAFRQGRCACIAEIRVGEVWHALRELLWRTAPAEPAAAAVAP